MTPSEHLKEIEEQVEKEHLESDHLIQPERSWLRTIEEREWLVARVKKLTHIVLESKHRMSSHTSRQGCADTCYACWARKTLEEE